ncbi:MAG: YraN family protein [Tissierellia bacterium]|nr:YraN family protein [Tissierellia bacterium]
MAYNIQTGRSGEDAAVAYLIEKGYKIIERNYRNRIGEIDIIAIDVPYDILVFLEIKSRRNKKYGYAFEAVNYHKQRKIINTSMMYVALNKLIDIQMRYDIIEVYFLDKEWRISHIKNAFDGG